MKPGRFWFSVPRPYSVQAPRLGRAKTAAARVDVQQGGAVRNLVAAVHRADDADVVDARADLRKQLADLDAALAVLLKFPGRGQQVARRGELELRLGERQRLAVISASFGLGSNESTCETPPCMNRKSTRLALAGKCGRGEPGDCATARAGLFFGQQARQGNAAEPTGDAHRASRRSRGIGTLLVHGNSGSGPSTRPSETAENANHGWHG